jgi:DNA-binding NtrC family response regulator
VVDDDNNFGAFLASALEWRGHEVDCVGSVHDAVSSLYTARYDLVVIDLRLPDGSGLDLLRLATDRGLLAGSSAIILTGQEFEPPGDIRVFHKSASLDALLDSVTDIVARTKARRQARGGAWSTATRGTSKDQKRPSKREKVELVLYTSAASEKSAKALKAIQQVLSRYDAAQVSFSVCDLAERPARATEDGIVFTPTLVKRGPGPRTWIVGNLEQPGILVDLLEVSGVDRRK